MKKNRPEALAFDVIETLFSLAPISDRLASIGLSGDSLPLFFSRMLRERICVGNLRVYKPFKEVATATLEVLIASSGIQPDPDRIESVVAAFAELPPHSDVKASFDLARSSGFRIIMLTNGSAKTTKTLLSRSALSAYVEKIISIDDIRHWKPNRGVYLYAARELSVTPERLALIAAHAWDTNGAGQAGLVTGWVRRQEREFPSSMRAPDVKGDTLEEVIRNLSRLDAADAA